MPDDTANDPRQIIADLQRELARCRAERDEALAQQTATAEVLQVISRSTFDLQPVLETLVRTAARLCDAEMAYIFQRDGEVYRLAANFGFPPEYSAFIHDRYPEGTRPSRGQIVGRSVIERAVVHIADLAADPEYASPEAITIGKMRTALGVPLSRDGEPLGVIVLARHRIEPFSDKQIDLVRTFADQAVIAMENARLITETREALEQQTATAEVLQVINSSPGDLAPVFDAILKKAHSLCGITYGSLQLYDGESFRAVAAHGYSEAVVERARQGFSPSPNHPIRGLLDGVPYVHIRDLAEIDDPAARRVAQLGGIRTSLFVALRKDGTLLGMISSGRKEIRPFADKEIALLQNFAAQAVIAMENARLITETREALEQQTATAEVLQVINASPGELAPVFDAMLEKAMHLCEADFGVANTFDGERLHTIAERGVPPAFAEWRKGHVPAFGPGTGPARILAGEKILHTVDLMESEGYRAGNPDRRALVDLGGARTHLLVALRKEDVLLGTLAIYRQEVQPFTDKQIVLLQNFAAQAVIAMENARLITETREALAQQTATAEVLGVINSSPGDLAPVFDAILEKARSLCGVAYGSLELYDGENFRAVATIGFSDSFADLVEQGYRAADSPDTRALIEGERFAHILDLAETDAEMTRSAVALEGHRTLLCVPLRREGQLLGMISSARKEVRAFSEKEIALLENFAAQAVIAMENARLITETRERSRDLQESLEYQTATSDVLKVISRSTFDLQPVLDTLVETATHLCGADSAGLTVRAGEGFRYAATYALESEYYAFLQQHAYAPGRDTMVGRVALEGKVVQIADIEADPEYKLSETITIGKMRTLLGVPLLRDGVVVGTINLTRHRVEPFTERQIELLRTFADQAVIAMENARLLGELRARTDEIAGWNKELEARVAAQLAEIERTGKLRRFLAPQLAELIVAQGDESILESHRREIVVVFCDLRGFTGFAERAEPEEVMALLRDYHAAMGPIVAQFEGTLDHYAGDGIMVFFNDPLPTPEPAKRAIEMALALREAAQGLLRTWRRHGHDLGFGVGISQGYATLGQIGFAERMDYTAIGTVTNLAARLCAEARDGQILISARVAIAVEDSATLEEIGDLSLKGLSQAVAVFNVVQ